VSLDRVVALVPAHDEGDRIGATVRSLASLAEVSEVIVVDDGSLDGTAAVALVPPQAGGGLGSVRRFAARAIALLSGFEAEQPLSGQRAVRGDALARCRPLAGGFGLETAMTIDAVRAGLRVLEVPAPGLAHRATGRGPAGFAHRGRQGLDILRAVGVRIVRRRRR